MELPPNMARKEQGRSEPWQEKDKGAVWHGIAQRRVMPVIPFWLLLLLLLLLPVMMVMMMICSWRGGGGPSE